jgi:multicomponent Na+:H+ antiporter subunit D
MGSVEANQPVLAVVVLGSGLLTAGYLLPVVYRAFFRTSDTYPVRAEASPMLLVPLVVTALAGLALGLGDVFRLDVLTSTVSSLVVGAGP